MLPVEYFQYVCNRVYRTGIDQKTPIRTEKLFTIIVNDDVFILSIQCNNVNNRSGIERIALILQAAIDGATATKMMCKVYMSYKELRYYLIILTENNLLAEYNRGQTFITTHQGQNFLRIYMELYDMVGATNGRNIITTFHTALLTNADFVVHASYHIQYLVTTIRSLFKKL